jgi:hypothetical protein
MGKNIARQPIFEAMQKEGFGRGGNETSFLLLCLKDGFASRRRYLPFCKKHFFISSLVFISK